MTEKLFTVRPAQESDRGFIFSTWMNALYYGNRWRKDSEKVPGAPIDLYGEMDEKLFFQCYRQVIDKILSKKTTSAVIACLSDDADSILGYAITEPEVLHFVFVKEAWRRIGIAKAIVPSDTKLVTHLTKMGYYTKKSGWKYCPFII